MRVRPCLGLATLMIAVFAVAIAARSPGTAVLPAKISKQDAAGRIFSRGETSEATHGDGHKTRNVTTHLSSAGRFVSGMYSSTKTRHEFSELYGVDELMFFLEGRVTLTSSDGSRMTVSAGKAVTGSSVGDSWTVASAEILLPEPSRRD